MRIRRQRQPAAPVGDAGPGGLGAGGITRRGFLRSGSLAAGAAAALVAAPGVLGAGELDPSLLGGDAAAAASDGGAGIEDTAPLVAHIVDGSSGEIAFYRGTEEVVTRNPALARAILRAAAR